MDLQSSLSFRELTFSFFAILTQAEVEEEEREPYVRVN
jgi:hypothetical protein